MKETINHYIKITDFRNVFDLNEKNQLWIKGDDNQYENLYVAAGMLGSFFDKEITYKKLELVEISKNEKDVFLCAYSDFAYDYCGIENTVMYTEFEGKIVRYSCYNGRNIKEIRDDWNTGKFYILKTIYPRYKK